MTAAVVSESAAAAAAAATAAVPTAATAVIRAKSLTRVRLLGMSGNHHRRPQQQDASANCRSFIRRSRSLIRRGTLCLMSSCNLGSCLAMLTTLKRTSVALRQVMN